MNDRLKPFRFDRVVPSGLCVHAHKWIPFIPSAHFLSTDELLRHADVAHEPPAESAVRSVHETSPRTQTPGLR